MTASSLPIESSELAIDLAVYKWLCNIYGIYIDIPDADMISASLSDALNDSSAKWTIRFYRVSQLRMFGDTIPLEKDDKVTKLTDLKSLLKSAYENKTSYPTESVNLLTRCLDITSTLNLELSRGIILKELGDMYFYSMANYTLAEQSYDKANWILTSYGCVQASSVVYDDWGTLNLSMSKYADASDHYLQAARLWEGLAKNKFIYYELAGKAYMRAGDAKRASGDFDTAMEFMSLYALKDIRNYSYASKKYDYLIKSLINVAQFNRERRDYSKALALLKEAQKACKYQPDLNLTSQTFEEISITYNLLNERILSQDALDRSKEALVQAVSEAEFANKKLRSAAILDKVTMLNLKTKALRGPRAYLKLKDFNKAIQLYDSLFIIYEKDKTMQTSFLRSKAGIMLSQKKNLQAIDILLKAYNLSTSINKSPLTTEILQDIAQIYEDLGNLNKAIETYSNIYSILVNNGNVGASVSTREKRAMLYIKSNQIESAIQDLKYVSIRYLNSVGDKWAAADAAISLSKLESSQNLYLDAIETLETPLGALVSDYSIQGMAPSSLDGRKETLAKIYSSLAMLYIQINQKDKALQTLVSIKKYWWFPDVLLALKQNSNKDIESMIADLNIIEEPGNAISDINNLKTEKIADNWAEYVQVCWDLSKRYSSDYDSLPIDPLDMYRIRNTIAANNTAIEYMPTDTALYIIITSTSDAKIYSVDLQRNSLASSIRKLRKTIKSQETSMEAGIPIPSIYDWQESSFTEIKARLEELYKELLTPIEAEITPGKTLSFILPADIAGVPFHALIKPNKSADPAFLIESNAVVYLTSGMLDSLSPIQQQINPKTDSAAVFADPQDNLPGARKEAFKIRNAYFNSRLYLGDKATAKDFKNECLNAKIIHLAAHYKISTSQFGLEIQLANNDTIKPEELLSIPNGLKMVTLSACESVGTSDPISNGTSRTAELLSLMGVETIVGGLWKLSDESAAELSASLYSEIAAQTSRVEAIRRAQLKMLQGKTFANPFYWACLAMFGSPN